MNNLAKTMGLNSSVSTRIPFLVRDFLKGQVEKHVSRTLEKVDSNGEGGLTAWAIAQHDEELVAHMADLLGVLSR